MAGAAAMATTVAMAGPAVDGVVACRNSRWPRRGRCCRRCEDPQIRRPPTFIGGLSGGGTPQGGRRSTFQSNFYAESAVARCCEDRALPPGSMALSTARYCRTRATASELLSFVFKGWGACPDNGMSTMIGKMMIGLAAIAIVSVATTMSVSAQQKKITAAIPKQACEMLTVDTQNWGRQTVQLCGPLGGPRGQATIKQRQMTPGK